MSSNPLAPPPTMQSGVQTTGSAISLTDAAAQGILGLTVDSSAVAPSLQTDMQNAQALATQWVNIIRPQVVNTLDGILRYNGVFQGMLADLENLANQLAAGDQSAIAPFQAELQQLTNATNAEYQIVLAVQQSLTTYSASISDSQRALNTDEQQLQVAIETDTQEMQTMQQAEYQLEEEEQEVYYDILRNNGHPLEQEFQVMMDEIEQTLYTLQQQMNQVSGAMQTEQNQINALQADINTLTAYLTDLGQLQGGVSGLSQGWEAMAGDYSNLLQDENITDYSVFTPDDIATAGQDWGQIAQLAQSFL